MNISCFVLKKCTPLVIFLLLVSGCQAIGSSTVVSSKIFASKVTESEIVIFYQKKHSTYESQSRLSHGIHLLGEEYEFGYEVFSLDTLEVVRNVIVYSGKDRYRGPISFDDEVFFDFDLSDFFDCEKSKNLCGKETYGCPVENSEVVSVNGLVVCGDNLLSFQFAEGSPTVKVLSSEFKSGDFLTAWGEGYFIRSPSEVRGIHSVLKLHDGLADFSLYSDNGNLIEEFRLKPPNCTLNKSNILAVRKSRSGIYVLLSCSYRGGLQLHLYNDGQSNVIYESSIYPGLNFEYLISKGGVLYEVQGGSEKVKLLKLN